MVIRVDKFTLKEFAEGKIKRIECTFCNGKGFKWHIAPWLNEISCSVCNGRGSIILKDEE